MLISKECHKESRDQKVNLIHRFSEREALLLLYAQDWKTPLDTGHKGNYFLEFFGSRVKQDSRFHGSKAPFQWDAIYS